MQCIILGTMYSLSLPQGVGVGLAQALWFFTMNWGPPLAALRSHLVKPPGNGGPDLKQNTLFSCVVMVRSKLTDLLP